MKLISLTIALICFINISFGQTSTKLRIPIAKEKVVLDSLVEKFKEAGALNGLGDNPCILISVSGKNGTALFSLSYLDSVSRSTIYVGTNFHFKVDNLRYFIFKNNFILVMGDNDPYNLLSSESKSRLFTIKEAEKKVNEVKVGKMAGYLYDYENGKFKILGDLRH
jgi:hypothetical protein